MIDEPQGAAYYGGDIAAPVFANIVSGALRVLAVPPDALPAPPVDRGGASAGGTMMAALAERDRTLGDLLGAGAGGYARLGVTDLTLDSRAVRPGAAFLAVPGAREHGLKYAATGARARRGHRAVRARSGKRRAAAAELRGAELESAARRARARVLRGGRADDRRRDGHERQDDRRLLARAGA